MESPNETQHRGAMRQYLALSNVMYTWTKIGETPALIKRCISREPPAEYRESIIHRGSQRAFFLYCCVCAENPPEKSKKIGVVYLTATVKTKRNNFLFFHRMH